jgi:RNA polymerase sigma-70 factor (ECF subfamily)
MGQRVAARPEAAEKPGGVVLPLAFAGDDRELVEALRAGHPGAKAEFFHRYAGYVERIITHVIGFDRELSDILQEVFLRGLASLHTLENAAALKGWLARVATHTARKVLRSRTRRSWLRLFRDTEEESAWEPSSGGSGEDLATRRSVSAVYAILNGLPSDERIAFALRFIEGMELLEVAAATAVSLATVKRRLRRAEARFMTAARDRPELREWIEGGSR